jgi:hypothetical protein
MHINFKIYLRIGLSQSHLLRHKKPLSHVQREREYTKKKNWVSYEENDLLSVCKPGKYNKNNNSTIRKKDTYIL